MAVAGPMVASIIGASLLRLSFGRIGRRPADQRIAARWGMDNGPAGMGAGRED
jgi:hypothetical protein